MKIPEKNIINIQSKHENRKFPADIEDGKIYSAKIIERSGKFSGILEISGKRLSAEFTQGLPRENILNLKAEIAENGRTTFKIVETLNQETLKNAIRPFTILSPSEIDAKLFDISRILSKNINSLFELNAQLIGTPDLLKKIRMKNLAEKLLNKGISRENVQTLFTVMSGTNSLKLILSVLGRINNKTDSKPVKQEVKENIRLEIDSIISQITSNFENPDDIIKEIMDLLIKSSDQNNKHSYSIFIDDNDNLMEYEYILNSSSFILNAEFSVLGKITVIIQDSRKMLYISIITESNDAENIINEDLNILKKSLARKDIKSSINTANNKNVLDNLNEINRIHQLNRVLDIKI